MSNMTTRELYQRLGIHSVRPTSSDPGHPAGMIVELETGVVFPIRDAFTLKLWRFITNHVTAQPAPIPNTRDWPESESGH